MDTIRARLAGAKGPQYWRGLEELAETEEFQQFLLDEFPQQARPFTAPVDRRNFLKLMGASLALAGMTGCGRMPQERIVPYVKKPEEIVPGKPLAFATAATLFGGYAIGVLAESYDGRPIKIEGNPTHPASLGATDAFAQASLLTLYDPDRSQAVQNLGGVSTWDAFVRTLDGVLGAQAPARGQGVRVLTETVTSPTLASQMQAFLRKYPQARWHQYDPTDRDNARAGARLAFGRVVNPVYRFDRANVILSLDGDFLLGLPGSVRYARDFIDRRRVRKERTEMNRLYTVESTPTLTGAKSDHRLPLRATDVEPFARAVAQGLGVAGVSGTAPASVPAPWLAALVRDLQGQRGASLVVPGEHQPPAVHALAHAMNAALGNLGRTVVLTEPVEASPVDQLASLRNLVDDMEAGRVEMLVVLGGNPVYTAPADFNFAERLLAFSRDRMSVRLGQYYDETSALCQWHIPQTHYLEEWSDARAYDGTVTIVQPLIAPLYDSKSVHEVMAQLIGAPAAGYDIVRGYWAQARPSGQFDKYWEKILNDGVVPDSAALVVTPAIRAGFSVPAPSRAEGLEIVFQPDPTVWDGRFANNPWLQELPKPISKLTWDNAVLMSPATAQRNGLANEDFVDLTLGRRTLRAAVWIQPGHADESVTLHLGYGRNGAGQVGTGMGFNAFVLRTSEAMGFGTGLQMEKAPGRYKFATTQYHHSMEGRDIVRYVSIENFRAGDIGAPAGGHAAQDPHGVEPHAHGADDAHGAEAHGGPGAHAAGEESRPEASGASGVTTAEDLLERGRPPVVPADPRDVWEYKKQPHGDGGDGVVAEHAPGHHPSLYPEYSYEGFNAWGMAIDLNACIGCNACTVSCQAENNIPVVGKEQVMKGREMHWIRIDSYYRGDVENPEVFFQPVPCMHCEKAPCEPVCPVAATLHSHEGLNQMIYNRCIGTRYCSNNCPYKVRRFNFLKYTAGVTGPRTVNYDLPVLRLLANPEVTIRSRGVMEKCTYCVQRINRTRIETKKEGRPIRDGEVIPACAQACPTEAIIFGDIQDPASRVAQLKAQPHNYGLLDELNTQPRTTYLAGFRNPNPELAEAGNRAPATETE